MSKIVRTPTKVLGGITPEEKVRLDAHAAKWIANAMSTEAVVPERLVPAIHSLYEAAGLKRPRVVIVPSPIVMAFSGGFAAAIWWARKNNARALKDRLAWTTRSATGSATGSATYSATHSAIGSATDSATDSATGSATYSATDSATDSAIRSATSSATHSAIRSATHSATDSAIRSAIGSATDSATDSATGSAIGSATDSATGSAIRSATRSAARFASLARELGSEFGVDHIFMLRCAQNWWRMYQGGNMWGAYDCYLTAFRDVLGLVLPEHERYRAWEACAIEGGFRIMHEEFCIVSDRPEVLLKDEQNRPHCETGPSHRWRDGFELYYWHGVEVPREWILEKHITVAEALRWPNVEQRRAACELLGWAKVLESPDLNPKVIDEDEPSIGTLIQVDLPEAPAQWFLKYRCGTGRWFAESVNDKSFNTALKANAGGNGWRGVGDPLDFIPFART